MVSNYVCVKFNVVCVNDENGAFLKLIESWEFKVLGEFCVMCFLFLYALFWEKKASTWGLVVCYE